VWREETQGQNVISGIRFKGAFLNQGPWGKQMNERIIKIAHIVMVGVLVLAAIAIVAAQQNRDTSQQGQNSNQSGGQQNRNANRQTGNANTGRNMNGNMNNNSSAGGNMNRNMSGQAAGQSMAVGSNDRKFAMEAAMGGMAEVELGRLAAERGASDGVKQFGQRMVDDHSRANSELMQWASGKGITLPTTLDAKHQALMTRMRALSGAAFDSAYAREMVKDHEKDVALFQREASRGTDADLKSFAQRTLPTLQEHLTMARALPSGSGHGSMNGNMNQSRQR
jgi:putative membrane protein